MKSRIAKFAATAVIIIVVLTGIYMFVGSNGGSGVVWADVVNNLENIQTYQYQQLETVPDGPVKEERSVIRHSVVKGTRLDSYYGDLLVMSIFNLRDKKEKTTLVHLVKFYQRFFNTAVGYKQDPKEKVKEFLAGDYTELGRSTIDGVEVEGIELEGVNIVPRTDFPLNLINPISRLWVGVDSGLPVRIEVEGLYKYPKLTNYPGNPEASVSIVQDQFQWDIEFDPEIFVPIIPDDYTPFPYPMKTPIKK